MTYLLQFQAAQGLALTPQMQRSLKLLQLSAPEFRQQLQTVFSRNPFLEFDEPGDEAGGELDRLSVDIGGGAPRADLDDADRDNRAAPVGLRSHLRQQIGASPLAPRDALVATLVAEAVDDDGYLRVALEDIAASFPSVAPDADELRLALRFVQSLDPAGVAARDPAECLLLQLERADPELPGLALARRIVREHIALLARHDSPRLASLLGCSADAIDTAQRLIMTLDPHPGHRFGEVVAPFVVADVIVGRDPDGRWRARINPATLPRLKLNWRYVEIFRAARAGEGRSMAGELQEARWLLRNVRQRFRTICEVAQAIVDRQAGFFAHGATALQPLLQRDVAQDLGMHESTVSRVANGKYMASPQGIVEFRRFFGSTVQAIDGRPCASAAVQAMMCMLIAKEDPRQPLSDLLLMRALEAGGIRIARRTVTKYRDRLGIPPWRTRQLVEIGRRLDRPGDGRT